MAQGRKKKRNELARAGKQRPAQSRTDSRHSQLMAVVVQQDETIQLRLEEPARAERTFHADCADAVMRHGTPVLRFVQLDPVKEAATRVLVVRYDADVFAERSASNESFRTGLHSWLKAQGRTIDGCYQELAAKALGQMGDGVSTAMIDADFEIAYRAGNRAGLTFLSTHGADRLALAQGEAEEIPVSATIEVAMMALPMTELFDAWKELVEGELK